MIRTDQNQTQKLASLEILNKEIGDDLLEQPSQY